jgi:hypothetical protein
MVLSSQAVVKKPESLCPWWVNLLGTCYADVEAEHDRQRLYGELAPPIVPPPAPETPTESKTWDEEKFWAEYYRQQQESLEKHKEGLKPDPCPWYQTMSDDAVCETNWAMVAIASGVGLIALVALIKR